MKKDLKRSNFNFIKKIEIRPFKILTIPYMAVYLPIRDEIRNALFRIFSCRGLYCFRQTVFRSLSSCPSGPLPARQLAMALKGKKKEIEIRFVGSNKGLDRRIFEKERFGFHLLSANKLPY